MGALCEGAAESWVVGALYEVAAEWWGWARRGEVEQVWHLVWGALPYGYRQEWTPHQVLHACWWEEMAVMLILLGAVLVWWQVPCCGKYLCKAVKESEHCVLDLEHFSSFILPCFSFSED